MADPPPPVVVRLRCRLFGIEWRRGRGCRIADPQYEADAVAFANVELGGGIKSFLPERDVGVENCEIGPDAPDRAMPIDLHQCRDEAVSEAQGKLHADRDLAANADNLANEARLSLADRHEIYDAHGTTVDAELSLNREGIRAIAPRRAFARAAWRNHPPAVLLVANERCQAGIGVEARPAQPVDRSVFADQCGRLAIADQAVIFKAGCHEPCEWAFKRSGCGCCPNGPVDLKFHATPPKVPCGREPPSVRVIV